MGMSWFPFLAGAIGLQGTRAAVSQWKLAGRGRRSRDWVLTLVVVWSPMALWLLWKLARPVE